jgi:hypothetical protein
MNPQGRCIRFIDHRLRALLLSLLVVAAAPVTTAQATTPLPQAALAYAPEWRPLGSGQMRWFGLRLYDAELWISGERFVPERPHALALRYHRAIAAERLVESSIAEMRRLGVQDEARLAVWRDALARAFPSVAPNESIVGMHLPGRGAVFWHDGRRTAEIDDPELARWFFAIWLDERTREPALRARLLGGGAR